MIASPSKSFAAALVCFSLGVAMGPLVPIPGIGTIPLVFLGVGLVVWALVRDRQARFIGLLLACVAFGVWRYGQAILPPSIPTVADAVGHPVRVEGTVVSEVERSMSGARATIDDVRVADERVDGKVLMWFPTIPAATYGDTLTFNCTLAIPEPIDGFRYDAYLRSQGVLALCFRPQYVDVRPGRGRVIATLLAVKRVIVDRFARIVPEPHASFLSGLLFGGSSALSSGLKDDFAATGTSHVLAASGFNVSLFTLAFLTWITHTALGRRRGAYLTAALLVAYVLVAGATAAVVRAGTMGAVVLLGFVVRRKPSVTNMMLLALAGMLAWNPLLFLNDVGFQLSFVATAAMLAFASRIERRCGFVPAAFELRASFAASLAAIIATFPILLWHFGTVSLTSPIVNLIVLPLVPLLMAISGVALAAGFVHPALGTIVAIPAWAISSLILHVVTWFGSA
ncbi:hypothetical protein A2348_05025 [Candidatus Uhrbacteria bacterium RIFOXYB12_FULL_58_10]|nr:MAG: hypothetical protein A2348_05025 [Candidatus Uhrbacteria bacterium RIFOXYB12_FULL_58_10]